MVWIKSNQFRRATNPTPKKNTGVRKPTKDWFVSSSKCARTPKNDLKRWFKPRLKNTQSPGMSVNAWPKRVHESLRKSPKVLCTNFLRSKRKLNGSKRKLKRFPLSFFNPKISHQHPFPRRFVRCLIIHSN
uniref:Uncharacterized protein n=1 Tax=Coxiella burnetii TaxID=777 RepID=O52896_COXBE|nr:hypothetical protein [Coxiella burnetii]CAA75858.1 hypothetical protein [Coxiella burnetii]